MDPITIFLIGLAATAASTAMSYNAQRQAGKQADYNADHAAKVEEMKAEEERARRAAQERQERKQTRMRRASIEAKFAASGLLMTGTPAYMLEEQAKADEMNILEGNRISDTGFMRSMERAKLIRQQGSFDKQSANYGATTSLISGLGSAALQTASFKAAGGFGGKTAGGDNALFTTVSASEGWTTVG